MYARLIRLYVFCILALLAFPATFFLFRYMQSPSLYEGDRIETRTCRDCGGSGKDESLGHDYPELGNRCPACGGDGKVDVILPGPHRPTRIRGVVVDAARVNPYDTYHSFRPAPSADSPMSFQQPAGTIEGATMTFRDKDGNTVEVASNSYGLITVELVPGSYHVVATSEGFATLEADFAVPVLTEPIWLEEANIVREPHSAAEAQSLYGLEMLVALAKAGTGQGHLNVSEGAP